MAETSERTDRWAIVGDGCWWKVCGGHWAIDPSEHEGPPTEVMPVAEHEEKVLDEAMRLNALMLNSQADECRRLRAELAQRGASDREVEL